MGYWVHVAGYMLWALLAGTAGFTTALNASELVNEGTRAIERPAELPALSARASVPLPVPEPTVLPAQGIAAALGPNETHYYSLNLSATRLNYSISLAECVRVPLDGDPLTLRSGRFRGSTADGGLLNIANFTELNNTLVVSSPPSDNAQAQWSYQLGYDDAAMYESDYQGLFWVDSDFANSLFVTATYKNFTKLVFDTPYMDFVNKSNLNATTRGFHLFLHNVNGTNSSQNANASSGEQNPLGPYGTLGKSFCAMQNEALLNQNNADFSTTDRSSNSSNKPYRGQFLFTGLNSSTQYVMQLGIPPREGYLGGMLFDAVPFRTKQSKSCQLIYNMTTCPNTAFSVPGNASAYTVNELTELYDHYVGLYYNNFTQALAQVNCNATRENMFSVFSTCDNCNTAYLDWLCTVAVPRCEDWSNTAPYLKERLPGTSRNQIINDILRPGKYKEVLPCYWLCDNLATFCPTSMGFGCPSGYLLNESYGWPEGNGDVSCSYPGAVYRPDAGMLYGPSWVLLASTFVALLLI